MIRRSNLIIVFITALLIVSCSQGTSTIAPTAVKVDESVMESSPAPESNNQGSETKLNTPSASPAVIEPTEISFWYPYGEGSWTGKYIAEKIGSFNSENSNIKIKGQSFESYTAILESLQRSAASKTLPGVATIAYGMDRYIIGSGLAHPIDDYLGSEKEAYLSDFYPSLLKVTAEGGKVYGVPLALSVPVVFYHEDLFTQAGLDPQKPPQTWEEFLQTAETIHDKLNIPGATFALDDPWTFEVAVRSNGGSLIDEDGKTATLDAEVPVKVLEDWANAAQKGVFLYSADFNQILQTFGNKGVAMFAVSSYGTVYYHDTLPTVHEMRWPAGKGKSIQSPAGGNSLYIFGNNDAERQAAARWIQYLSQPEAIADWAVNSGYLPTRKSALDKMSSFIDGFDNYKVAVSEIDTVVTPLEYPGNQTPKISANILKTIEAAMLGSGKPAELLSQANQEVNALIQNQ